VNKISNIVIIPALLLMAIWSSCEDVIDIQTTNAPTQIVVDAWLNNLSQQQEIKLSYSQPYFDSSFAKPILEASIEIRSEQGNTFVFKETGSGHYTWQPGVGQNLGEIGDIFELSITLADQNILGTSIIHPVPEIDSISQEFRENDLRGPDGIYTQFFARDLQGLGNTYWIKSYKNDLYLNKPDEINLAFDAGFDGGSQLDGIIFIPPIRELTNPVPDAFPADEAPYKAGDQLRVEIHSLTIEAFEFMSSVRDQILNGSNTIFASPIANSKGNLTTNKSDTEVLGVFCISAVASAELIIK
jgi:hypothetical protein